MKSFGKRFLLGGLLSFLFDLVSRRCCYSYPTSFLIIFHTVLVFVRVFIFDVKFFHVSRFASLNVLCALALQFLKNSRFFLWVLLNFLSVARCTLTAFLHSLLYHGLLNFG